MKRGDLVGRNLLIGLVLCAACAQRGSADAANEQATAASVQDNNPAPSDSVSTTPAGAMEYYSIETLRGIAESAARSGNPTKTFGRHPNFWYVESQRTVTGSVEVHANWIDATVIQAGNGSLRSGGSVSGGRAQGRGEHRGGQIHGGSERRLGAGDFVVIPAGVPHQYEVSTGDSLRYLTVKIAK